MPFQMLRTPSEKSSAVIKGSLTVAFLVLLFSLPAARDLASALDPDRIEVWLQDSGALAPFLLIGLVALAVVINPIPGLPLDLAAGAVFGPLLGAVYVVAGGLLGAVTSFLIARFLGREFLMRFLGGQINFCSHCSDRLLSKVVFLSRLLPIFSFDVVSYGAGLTRMSLGKFSVATTVGMIPSTLGLTYFGASLRVSPKFTLIAGVALVALFSSCQGGSSDTIFSGGRNTSGIISQMPRS
jgi:uncharacterized membrane protein YdjX (TVP38/TMEM64 family)